MKTWVPIQKKKFASQNNDRCSWSLPLTKAWCCPSSGFPCSQGQEPMHEKKRKCLSGKCKEWFLRVPIYWRRTALITDSSRVCFTFTKSPISTCCSSEASKRTNKWGTQIRERRQTCLIFYYCKISWCLPCVWTFFKLVLFLGVGIFLFFFLGVGFRVFLSHDLYPERWAKKK